MATASQTGRLTVVNCLVLQKSRGSIAGVRAAGGRGRGHPAPIPHGGRTAPHVVAAEREALGATGTLPEGV
jgi:hypothetical protein